MARVCEFCNKGRLVGNKVSHSNIKTKKVQQANIRRVRATIGGTTRRVRICTRCLRSGMLNPSA
ncbi:MAG: 50S ribosomal protein L28 [Myxococcales bacterium]|nr:50S ribosomal protein L28 [Myxococcota bacterium]MDW8283805.1 50S ribosomal protein L28 [Myxococcales bacterium]